MTPMHVFVTRLGIGVLNEAWLSARLDLLASTVLPSLRKQSETRFHWLIGVGNDMPAASRAALDVLLEQDPRFEVVELDHLRDGLLPRHRMQALHRAHGGLITTRIDDDDALHRLAVEEIQEAARKVASGDALIYHPLGYELQVIENKVYPLELHGPSMGLSMLSVGEGYRDAYGLHHMRTRIYEIEQGVSRVLLQPDRPSWLYVRHPLGDSAQGGDHRMASTQGIALDQAFMGRLEQDFGIRATAFQTAMQTQSRYTPRTVNKSTLLDERMAVMVRLREVLKKVDRLESEAQAVPEVLAREKEALFADYLRLSQQVFN